MRHSLLSRIIVVQLITLALAMSAKPADPGGMVRLTGGAFVMGRPDHDPALDHAGDHISIYEDEKPAHRVTLSSFYLDATEVTNSQFGEFVGSTSYRTDAEKRGTSWIFRQGLGDWEAVGGADWRHPIGPDSTISDKMNHPVVNVSWNDAWAYAKWAGKRLPTEAEWEYAAAGGRQRALFPWGNELKPDGKLLGNFWQGSWPDHNALEDGYYYTAPVRSFARNSFGLYDMIGNVWEWTADWYGEGYYKRSPSENPKGPRTGEMRVARGGSWFCSEGYCSAYRTGFRGKSPQDSSFNNVGFRCARGVISSPSSR